MADMANSRPERRQDDDLADTYPTADEAELTDASGLSRGAVIAVVVVCVVLVTVIVLHLVIGGGLRGAH